MFNNPKKENSGAYAEHVAATFLQKQRIKVIAKNFICKVGEIDIIGIDQNTIVFVEVRFRRSDTHGSAAQSITKSKQRKVIKSAQYWLTLTKNENINVRFDSILFDKYIDQQHLTWLKAAF